MKRFDIRDITDISNGRLFYRDGDGGEASFDLAVCARNFAAARGGGNHKENGPRCVGERCFFGDTPYYEFYTDEKIRFCLELKTNPLKRLAARLFGWDFHKREHDLFHSVQKRLVKTGFTTFDLS